MQLWVAILLFLLSVAGAVLSARKLRHNKPLRVVCIALCAVIAAACAVYIALTAIMLYAASTSDLLHFMQGKKPISSTS
ncbi:MAG: hypothetical protein ACLTG0_01250 [Oscillibacter sp.]